MKTQTAKYEIVYTISMTLHSEAEGVTISKIIPDIIPDEKKPLESIFFEEAEEFDDEEEVFDSSR